MVPTYSNLLTGGPSCGLVIPLRERCHPRSPQILLPGPSGWRGFGGRLGVTSQPVTPRAIPNCLPPTGVNSGSPWLGLVVRLLSTHQPKPIRKLIMKRPKVRAFRLQTLAPKRMEMHSVAFPESDASGILRGFAATLFKGATLFKTKPSIMLTYD